MVLDVLSDEVESVMRGSRVFTGIVATSLLQAGSTVSLPQLRTLVLIQTRPGVNARTIADALDVHPSNASRLLDRLVQAGLVERRDSEEDRRHLTLSLTPEGTRHIDEVMEHRRIACRRILEAMPAVDRRRLARGLDVFADTAGESHGW